ncbi:MAG: MMPL family transporter [Elusimicrobiota bacterium]
MKRIIEFGLRRPFLVLFVLAAISAAAATQLRHLTVNVAADGMMRANDPEKAFLEETLDTFGSDNITVVFVEDEELFDADKLEAIAAVALALEDIEGVIKVDSLFNLQNFRDVDGTLQTDPFLEEIPETEEDAGRVKEDALRNPLIARNAISWDGTAMAINVYVRNEERPDGTKEEDFDARIAGDIDEAIAPLKGEVDRVFQMGMPFTRKVLGEKIVDDQKLITPLALGALLIALVLCLRSLNGAVMPLMSAGLSILWTFGFMGAAGLPVTLLTAIVPALLIVIGSTEDIHLLSEYTEGVAHGNDRPNAIRYMASKLGLAILLTFITTYLGFFSIAFNDIRMLKEFGIVASSGLLFNFVVTVLATPLYLRFFGRAKAAKGSAQPTIFDRGAEALIVWIRKNTKVALTVSIIAVVLVGMGAVFVRVDNNVLAYFKKNSEVRRRTETLAERLAGMQSFYIVLTGRDEGTFRDPHFLKEIRGLQDHIKSTKLFDASFSIADYMALINREWNGGGQEHFKVPKSREMLAQYMMLLRQPDVEQYVSTDRRKASVLVRHHIAASYDLSRALEQVAVHFKGMDKRLDIRFTGEEILTNKAADSMAAGQAKSLLALVVIIFVMMSVLFLNVKAGALSLVPNAYPVFVLFGVMGYFSIPLDVGTAMIASIAIGIAIDDTIHFMVRYNKEMRETADETKALERTIRAEATPVISTSLALALGFGILMASSFVPVIWFGALTALLMIVALLADLVITPMVLSYTRFVTLWDMVSVQVGKKVIDGCALFQDMPARQIKKVILLSKVKDVPGGEKFIRQGDIGREMFVVLEGQAKAEKVLSDGSRRTLGTFGQGEVLGEIALVTREMRNADVTAIEDTKLLVLEWRALEQLAKAVPKISTRLFLNISRIISNRLVNMEHG